MQGVQDVDRRSAGNQAFGINTGIATGTTPEDIWSQGGEYTFLTEAKTLYLSSSDNSDTQNITIVGLDENWNYQATAANLTGQTQAAIPGKWIRVNTMVVTNGVATAGDVYLAPSTPITGGVPDDLTGVKAKIESAWCQSLMCIHSVAGNVKGWAAGLLFTLRADTPADTAVDLGIRVRDFGHVWRTVGILTLSSNYLPSILYNFAKWVPLSPRSDIVVRAINRSRAGADCAAFMEIIEDPIIGAG